LQVLDQVRRPGNAKQAKRQPVELRVLTAAVVALPDGGEELVSGEAKAAHGVDLVHEDHQAGGVRGWGLGVGGRRLAAVASHNARRPTPSAGRTPSCAAA